MSEIKTTPLLDSQNDTILPKTSRTFYGWWIVLAGTVILFVSSGIGFYRHGVILDPLRALHGWSKATIFGPSIAGFIFDATRSYRTAFTIFAAMSFVAILVIYFAKPPKPDKVEMS